MFQGVSIFYHIVHIDFTLNRIFYIFLFISKVVVGGGGGGGAGAVVVGTFKKSQPKVECGDVCADVSEMSVQKLGSFTLC